MRTELAGLQAFLVVASAGVDAAANQQSADELVGTQVAAKLNQGEVGVGRIHMQTVDLGESGEERCELRMNRIRSRSYWAWKSGRE